MRSRARGKRIIILWIQSQRQRSCWSSISQSVNLDWCQSVKRIVTVVPLSSGFYHMTIFIWWKRLVGCMDAVAALFILRCWCLEVVGHRSIGLYCQFGRSIISDDSSFDEKRLVGFGSAPFSFLVFSAYHVLTLTTLHCMRNGWPTFLYFHLLLNIHTVPTPLQSIRF